MTILKTKRLDHLGLVMGTFQELDLIQVIDQILGVDPQAKLTHGQAIAAMIVNGLGFTSKPLYLTPQFFATKPIDMLFGDKFQAEDFNRYRLARALDKIYQYGCEAFFSQVASSICQKIGLSTTFTSLDTTTFSVSGKYDRLEDEHEIKLTHGYSKDHRPDLKQAVLELVTSQDGGVPLMLKCWDGNTSDSKIFQERAQKLIFSFQEGQEPSYLVADCKLYQENNIEMLSQLRFITRIPKTYREENELVRKSIAKDESCWNKLDEQNHYQEHAVEHLKLAQRWLVVKSKTASTRSEKAVDKQIAKEAKLAQKAIEKLMKQEFGCKEDAQRAFNQTVKGWEYHQGEWVDTEVIEHYVKSGRPKKGIEPTKLSYKLKARLISIPSARQASIEAGSCYVIGTNLEAEQLKGEEVIEAYKNQHSSIERGFRFLKSPEFFVSSFYVKTVGRLMGLLVVMTLGLLVYSIMERAIRKRLAEQKESLPDQLEKETTTPTMRWIFQMMEGIDVLYIQINQQVERQIMGINQVRSKIISLFPACVKAIYLTG